MTRIIATAVVLGFLFPLNAKAQSITLDSAAPIPGSNGMIKCSGTWASSNIVGIHIEAKINNQWTKVTGSLVFKTNPNTWEGTTWSLGKGTWEVRGVLQYFSGTKIVPAYSNIKTVVVP